MIEEKTKHIQIAEYNYPLPDERIAKFPLAERDHSKLLVYNKGTTLSCIATMPLWVMVYELLLRTP